MGTTQIHTRCGRQLQQLALALVVAVAAALGADAAKTKPLETRFFEAPVVSMSKIGQQPVGTMNALSNKLNDAISAGQVSEFRILRPTTSAGVKPPLPDEYWVEIWYNGARNYLAAHDKIMVATPCVAGPGSCINYILTTGIGTCKLCKGTNAYVNTQDEWHGYFINDQSNGAYPIQGFFQAALPLTAAESGTLDYAMTKKLNLISDTELDIEMNDVTFFEIYTGADAFDTHVVNVNKTLAVENAPNWFTDLGSVFSQWFYVEHRSGWCSYCQKPPSTFWVGQDTNPGRAGGGGGTSELTSSEKDGRVQHMVLMNIRGDAPEDQVKLLSETAYEMTNLGTVDRLSFGQAYLTNDKDLAHPKFNYGLLVTHPNKKAAADYQTDPLHEKFKAISKPLLEDSGCGKVFTLNYIPPEFYQSGVGSVASGFIGFAVGALVGALSVCACNHIKNRRQTSGDNEYSEA